ncbi:hypothetical protein WA026_022695 [Henosepilachna vigintioctopunctata]|uniref:Uncharacterized protein n=1 Tax=Henosepilachna vigintioctopunctata TaxID=420089 RepID=A0AAW1TXM4_9CUCU
MKCFIFLNLIIYFIIVFQANAVPIGLATKTTWSMEPTKTNTKESPFTAPNPDPYPKKDISNSIAWNIILDGSSINNSKII